MKYSTNKVPFGNICTENSLPKQGLSFFSGVMAMFGINRFLNSGSPAMSAPSTAARRSLPSKSWISASKVWVTQIASDPTGLRRRQVMLDTETKFFDGTVLIGMNRQRHSGMNMRKFMRKDTPSSSASLSPRLLLYLHDPEKHCDTEQFAAFPPNVKTFAQAPLPHWYEVMAECSIAITPDSLRSWSLEEWDSHTWNPWNQILGCPRPCTTDFQSQILRSLSKHNQTQRNLPSEGKYTTVSTSKSAKV